MGLIQTIQGVVTTTLQDQFKEYFTCDAMPDDLLMVKATKHTTSRSFNNKVTEDIITNGSVFVVADGQCAIIVDQGAIVEICAVPGAYTYDMSSEPSVFSGNLASSIIDTFKVFGKRISFGGETGTTQRLYYINTKPIRNNLFGTRDPIPFRVVDDSIKLDIDTEVKCNGSYEYIITDPVLFYTNLAGNVKHEFKRSEIDRSLKDAFMSALQPALGNVADQGIRFNQLMKHMKEVTKAVNDELSAEWGKRYGIEIIKVNLSSPSLPADVQKMIRDAQFRKIDTDPSMAATKMLEAQAEALKLAAGNTATGPMMGFMHMNMAQQQMGGVNAQSLYQMGAQQQQQAAAANTWKCTCGASNTGKFCMECGGSKPAPAGAWTCKCGASNTGKFCMECGSSKPADANGWTCKCGAVNKGKFCMECGTAKPAGAPLYRCDKCGWEPEDPMNPPKFCPECADPFDDNDIKK